MRKSFFLFIIAFMNQDFHKFEINFPYTRLMKYHDMLVYKLKNEVDFGIQKANSLITELDLNLVAEKNNSVVLVDTIIIKIK